MQMGDGFVKRNLYRHICIYKYKYMYIDMCMHIHICMFVYMYIYLLFVYSRSDNFDTYLGEFHLRQIERP